MPSRLVMQICRICRLITVVKVFLVQFCSTGSRESDLNPSRCLSFMFLLFRFVLRSNVESNERHQPSDVPLEALSVTTKEDFLVSDNLSSSRERRIISGSNKRTA